MEESSITMEVLGEITTISHAKVVFQFVDIEGNKSVGVVSKSDVKGLSGSYQLKVGDKLKCTVNKENTADQDGKESKSEWKTTLAEVVEAESEDVIVLEDQMENMFDYEQEDDDDVEVVHNDSTTSDKSSGDNKTESEKPKESSKLETSKDLAAKTPAANSSVKKTIIKLTNPSSSKSESFQKSTINGREYHEKAKLFQLKHPPSSSPTADTTFCMVALTSGAHKSSLTAISRENITVWGYKLSNANLMYNLEYGDDFTVSYNLKGRNKKFPSDVIGTIGPLDRTSPAKASETPKFAEWLKSKGIKESDFMRWVNGSLPPKPHFPLISDIYAARIVGIAYDNNNIGVGAFVKITRLFKYPTPMVVKFQRIEDNSIAYLDREDFYFCGVSVGKANLCNLLWPDDPILVQARPMVEREKKILMNCLSQHSEYIVLRAYIGALGPERPKEQIMDPKDSPSLIKYLRKKNISLEIFLNMRKGINPAPILPEMPPVVQEMHPDPHPSTSGISKVMTEQGMVLKTKKTKSQQYLEEEPLSGSQQGSVSGSTSFKPSTRVEANFLKTHRLQPAVSETPVLEVTRAAAALPRTKTIARIFSRMVEIETADDPRVNQLLANGEEIKVAMTLSAILTKAITLKMDFLPTGKIGEAASNQQRSKNENMIRHNPEIMQQHQQQQQRFHPGPADRSFRERPGFDPVEPTSGPRGRPRPDEWISHPEEFYEEQNRPLQDDHSERYRRYPPEHGHTPEAYHPQVATHRYPDNGSEYRRPLDQFGGDGGHREEPVRHFEQLPRTDDPYWPERDGPQRPEDVSRSSGSRVQPKQDWRQPELHARRQEPTDYYDERRQQLQPPAPPMISQQAQTARYYEPREGPASDYPDPRKRPSSDYYDERQEPRRSQSQVESYPEAYRSSGESGRPSSSWQQGPENRESSHALKTKETLFQEVINPFSNPMAKRGHEGSRSSDDWERVEKYPRLEEPQKQMHQPQHYQQQHSQQLHPQQQQQRQSNRYDEGLPPTSSRGNLPQPSGACLQNSDSRQRSAWNYWD